MPEQKVKPVVPDLIVGDFSIFKQDGQVLISKNGGDPGRFTEDSFKAVIGLFYESHF